MQINRLQKPILRELEGGLILRRSSGADAEALADFCGRIHSDKGPDQPDLRIAAWTRDLLSKPHPTFHDDDFTVVEEAGTRRIVSALCLISQTWTYEGIPFGVGRPELVGTLPEYRKRGLIRLQMDEIHGWSAERGELVQAITGIPFYYRQFGYEMALDLSGRRYGYAAQVPPLADGETERIKIRPAASADLPFVADLYQQAQKRYAIAAQRGVDVLEYELTVQSPESINHSDLLLIEDGAGERLGYFLHSNELIRDILFAVGYELKPGVSWMEVSPAVVRYLWQKGQEFAAQVGQPCQSFGFMLGQEHPVYQALGQLLPSARTPYAWYLRVPDLPGFIRHIAPALEKRLAASVATGFSGELKLSFYRTGLRMAFEAGRLESVEDWEPGAEGEESAAFPGLTFLQLLFGYRSLEELEGAFADCGWNGWQAYTLLNALFPKRFSDVLALA
jgi:hypothetical protein